MNELIEAVRAFVDASPAIEDFMTGTDVPLGRYWSDEEDTPTIAQFERMCDALDAVLRGPGVGQPT